MSEIELIDAHTHAFPDETYGRWWQESAGLRAIRAGTLAELDESMRRGGVDRAVLLLFPRSRELFERLQQEAGGEHDHEELRARVVADIRRLNRWGCQVAASDPRFLAFVGVNARFMHAEEMIDEIEELAAMGARGVKLLPAAMQLYANDPSLFPVYETCAQRGLPVLSQSGSGGTQPSDPGADHFGRPGYFGEVLATFPALTLILAHLGRGYESDVRDLVRQFPRVFTDTSLRLGDLVDGTAERRREIVDLVRGIGVDRVVYGSNFPLADPLEYARAVVRLPFTAAEQRRVFSANLLEALGE